MRICFCNLTAGFKTGGLETYCWEAGHALAGLGHDVTVLGGVGGAARHDDVALQALPYTPRERYPDLGTRFRKFMERRSFARHALPALRDGGFDAVVVNKPYDFPLLWQLKRAGYKGVTVFRSGGTEFYWSDRWFARAVDRWAAVSTFNARQVEGRYGHPTMVIHNGVDAARFAPAARAAGARGRAGLPEDAFVVASAGRLIGLKGFSTIIDALPQSPPHVHYLILGDGPHRAALEREAAARGVAARVHLPGGIDHRELPAWLALADLYAQPSVGEESFGISVVEAMACGLPALVSDQGGLTEIVTDASVGRRLAPGDVRAWQAAIVEFAADAQLRQAAGDAARRRVEAAFSWHANAGKLLALIAGGPA